MSQIFTPRTTSHPATPETTRKSSERPAPSTSPWHPWKLRFVAILRSAWRLLTRLGRLIVRYTRRLSRTQRIQHAVIVIGIIILLFVLNQIFARRSPSSHTTQTNGGAAQLPKESPTFSTILPSGKSASDFGGWTRVSPTDRTPSYVYADNLAGVVIRVNEQQIPDAFKSDLSGSVEKLADDFGATHILDAGGTKIYIGKNAKGPQSLIFTKHNLLISITSNATIPDDQWITYIKSLQ